MSIPVEVLTAEALRLPEAERSQLLDSLLQSLEPAPIDAAWEQAWADEADRREADIDAGKASWIRSDEVIARLRAQLK